MKVPGTCARVPHQCDLCICFDSDLTVPLLAMGGPSTNHPLSTFIWYDGCPLHKDKTLAPLSAFLNPRRRLPSPSAALVVRECMECSEGVGARAGHFDDPGAGVGDQRLWGTGERENGVLPRSPLAWR